MTVSLPSLEEPPLDVDGEMQADRVSAVAAAHAAARILFDMKIILFEIENLCQVNPGARTAWIWRII
jgi:hypothetical protein